MADKSSHFTAFALPVVQPQPLDNALPAVLVGTPNGSYTASNDVIPQADSSPQLMGTWSSPLDDGDRCSSFRWQVCLCPCITVSQIEARLGLSDYATALKHHTMRALAVYALIVGGILLIVYSWADATNASVGIVLLVVAAVLSTVLSRRVAALRSVVRTRFRIAGSEDEDKQLAVCRRSRVLRQMARQVGCDSLGLFACPTADTLPAYDATPSAPNMRV
ncbi:TPA: hypothetical protein N0F65_005542 [Lagenidium giganteum]|uniref:Uncharacterized protein n=1 Tax=Lagenidium giganteum TaxID=4803 RepID=A0AAV2YU80_9STRA|nr:TPA: hypothetical protein N0F65_005542 [Lagenidium giganteum]